MPRRPGVLHLASTHKSGVQGAKPLAGGSERTLPGGQVIPRSLPLRPFGEEPSSDIKSRFYSSTGDTLDYVYELKGNTFMIWGEEKGSPAFFKGTFSSDGNTCTGAWVFPGGGGYESTMTRVTRA